MGYFVPFVLVARLVMNVVVALWSLISEVTAANACPKGSLCRRAGNRRLPAQSLEEEISALREHLRAWKRCLPNGSRNFCNLIYLQKIRSGKS